MTIDPAACRIVSVAACLFALTSVSACSFDRTRPAAVPYASSVSATSEDERAITVGVAAPGAGLEQVRSSAAFAVTRYCLEKFGASDARWTIDPSTQDWAIRRDGDRVLLSARCTFR